MNLLVTMKLPNRTVLSHIYPISLVDEVENIFIVRDTKGPNIDKVKYYCPPKWSLTFPPIALFIKFWLLLFLSILKKPRLIHSYLLFPHGYLALLVAKLTRKKAGISLIAGPVELYSFGGSPIGKYAYTKPLPELNIIGKFNRNLIKLFDKVVIAGSFSKDYLQSLGIADNKIATIPYMVLGRNLKRLNIEKVYDLIYVGRFVKVKHIESILYIAENLIKSYSFKNLKVSIIGDGPCYKELEDICRQLNIQNNVDFLGYVEDVGLFFNKSRLSIVTSERETGPFSAIESMMCGVPVISSACGDTVIDIVENDYNGVLVKDHNDIEYFTKKIAYLLNNPAEIDRYSKNAVETAQKIKVENVTKKWENILRL